MRATSPRRDYFVYRFLTALLSVLPQPLAETLGALGGRSYGRHDRLRRQAVADNLSRVLPDASPKRLEKAIDGVFSNYGRYWADVAGLTPRRARRVAERLSAPLEFDDLVEHHQDGAILVLPHLGVWEFGAAFSARKGMPLTSVVEPSTSKELDEFFERRRSALGVATVPLDEQAFTKLIAILRQGRVIALVADRDILHDGIEVELFGERTSLPRGPAALALRSGAPIIPCAIVRRASRRFEIVLMPPLDTTRTGRFRDDLERVTTALARAFEQLISIAPEQWLVLNPIWRSALANEDGR